MQIEGTSYLIDTSNTQLIGIIRSIDSNEPYDPKNKSEYEKLCEFVITFVQNTMMQTFCMQKVDFPTDK